MIFADLSSELETGASLGWTEDVLFDHQPVVMVVGKEEALGQMVAAELSDYEVRLISNPETALSLAVELSPDAIILGDDLGDPEVWELSRDFHHDENLRRIPVMVDSTVKNEGRMRAALESGVYDLLFRPFSRTELGLRVRNMVRSRFYLRQVEEKNRVLNTALSDLQESEGMLVQAEKLSQLGEMSAGIVHEINNPLNFSHTAIYMLKSMVDDLEEEQREEFSDVVCDVKEGLDRVGQIVRDLRSFASRSGSSSGRVNLASVVQTAARLLGHKLSNISYKADLEPELYVHGNENQLCQVLLNLMKNGVEATEEAGRSLENSRISVIGEVVGDQVILKTRDNGCGISPEGQKDIFKPFVSKKAKGGGMGLGLSICRRIVEDYGGEISVESEKESFTEFTLVFPYLDPMGND